MHDNCLNMTINQTKLQDKYDCKLDSSANHLWLQVKYDFKPNIGHQHQWHQNITSQDAGKKKLFSYIDYLAFEKPD